MYRIDGVSLAMSAPSSTSAECLMISTFRNHREGDAGAGIFTVSHIRRLAAAVARGWICI
jgi:hypothetical protein